MSIQQSVERTVAAVEVVEDYRVAVDTRRKHTVLDWAQAEQLAKELLDTVADARRMLAEDTAASSAPYEHGFDIDLDLDGSFLAGEMNP